MCELAARKCCLRVITVILSFIAFSLDRPASAFEVRGSQSGKWSAACSPYAVISFELSRFLYQQGRYAEASAVLQEGQRLYSANRGDFTNLIELAETAIAAQRLYEAADRAKAGGREDLRKPPEARWRTLESLSTVGTALFAIAS